MIVNLQTSNSKKNIIVLIEIRILNGEIYFNEFLTILVYLLQGNKTNASYVRNSDRVVSNSENDSSLSSSFRGTSPTSTLTSAYEDAESGNCCTFRLYLSIS